MKRGFTLIELLAVIVILAIIALIATPIVLSIINAAKESTLVRSAEFYLNGVEISVSMAKLNNKNIKKGTYSIMEDGNICLEEYDLNTRTCKDNDGNPNNNELIVEVKGEKPNSGKVSVNEEGKVAMSLYNDTYYTKKDYDDSNVNVYKIIYYDTFRGAVTDINNDEIGANANATKATAEAGVYINKENEPTAILLKDTIENDKIVVGSDMTINLNGNTLTFENSYIGIDTIKGNTNTIIIDGRLDGSTMILNGIDGGGRIITSRSSDLIIEGGTYILKETVLASDYRAIAISINGGTATINDSKIVAYSNNIYENGSHKVHSNGIQSAGILTLKNCYVMGTNSGVSNFGTLYIEGGTYEGYEHGGIYFSGTGTTAYVSNVIIRECDMPEGYTTNIESNNAGFYIGGASGKDNIKVYMDNCEIHGSLEPLVFRGSAGEKNNTLFISNSNIYTNGKIRIDNDTHKLYIGKGNNFTADNTTLPSAVENTDAIYTRENIEK